MGGCVMVRYLTAGDCLWAPVDPYMAVYNPFTGLTHILPEDSKALLDYCSAAPLPAQEVYARLVADYEWPDEKFDVDDLVVRLDELARLGLLHRHA